MQLLRSARWLLLALLVSLFPASSQAQISITVGFAPPMLPVYEQPLCPEPNLMWVPGYWAWGDGDYYWVPGAWVVAPFEGALWTPNYWDWSGGRYRFHRGYWGRHVGYYGGVNYGYGYEGVGFSGGQWRGSQFAYNTAVMRVDHNRIRDTYDDRAIVERNTVARGSRAAYNGGPGGIRHAAAPQERIATREQHVAPTQYQTQHVQAAQADRGAFAKANGGHPRNVVAARPLGVENRATPGGMKSGQQVQPRATPQRSSAPARQQQSRTTQQEQAGPVQRQQNRPVQQQARPMQQHANPVQQQQARPAQRQQARPAPQQQARPVPQQQARPMQQHANPVQQQQARPAQQQQARPAPQQQARPAQQQQARPAAGAGSSRAATGSSRAATCLTQRRVKAQIVTVSAKFRSPNQRGPR